MAAIVADAGRCGLVRIAPRSRIVVVIVMIPVVAVVRVTLHRHHAVPSCHRVHDGYVKLFGIHVGRRRRVLAFVVTGGTSAGSSSVKVSSILPPREFPRLRALTPH
jgi:hypothetical protein